MSARQSNPTRLQQARTVALGMTLWVGVLLIGIVAVRALGVVANTGDQWTLILCAFFLVFVSRIDDLALLSLGPLKAELRAKVTEAEEAIEQIRTLAARLAGFVLTQTAASWFLEGEAADDQLRTASEWLDLLDRIGVSEEERHRARERWDIGVAMVFARAIAEEAGKVKRGGKTLYAEIDPASPSFVSVRPWHATGPDDIEAELTRRNLIVGDVPELLADYRQFCKTGTFRRRDVFVKAAAG